MFTRAASLMIDQAQRQQLESWARAGTTPQRVARKCQVILLASQGISNQLYRATNWTLAPHDFGHTCGVLPRGL